MKPEGYSTVSPYLIAAGAQRVVDFMKASFNAIELRRYDLPDGSIMHAEVRIGDTVVMIGDSGDEWPAFRRSSTSTLMTSMRCTTVPLPAAAPPFRSRSAEERIPIAGAE